MDPITAAIMAALPAIASGLVSSVKDAYEGLKGLIRSEFSGKIGRRFGSNSGLEGSGCRPRLEYQSSQSYCGCRGHAGVGQAPR